MSHEVETVSLRDVGHRFARLVDVTPDATHGVGTCRQSKGGEDGSDDCEAMVRHGASPFGWYNPLYAMPTALAPKGFHPTGRSSHAQIPPPDTGA
jgi:hypothetical protein